MKFIDVRQASGNDWQAAMAIYEASFPAWEKQPQASIAEDVVAGRDQLVVARDGDRILGFYLISSGRGADHWLFSYLVVAADVRGRGVGQKLCRHAVARYQASGVRALFIEAEARQALLYGRLGFQKLDIEYHMPRFDGSGSVPMALMCWPDISGNNWLDGNFVRSIVAQEFRLGYKLAADDPRVSAQLVRIPDSVRLLAWGQDN